MITNKKYIILGITDTEYFCKNYNEREGNCTKKGKEWGDYTCSGCGYLDKIKKPNLIPINTEE